MLQFFCVFILLELFSVINLFGASNFRRARMAEEMMRLKEEAQTVNQNCTR